MKYTLCVTGTEVKGGAQKVEVTATTLPQLLAGIEAGVEFKSQKGSPTIESVALLDPDFGEYVLVKKVTDLPSKGKVKVELVPPPADTEAPSAAVAHQGLRSPQKSAASAIGFYSDVCDTILLPAIEELTGASATAMSSMLSEAFVNDDGSGLNPMLGKLARTVSNSVKQVKADNAAKLKEMVSPAIDAEESSGRGVNQSTARNGANASGVAEELFPASSGPAKSAPGPRKSAPPARALEPAAVEEQSKPASALKSTPARKSAPPSATPQQQAPAAATDTIIAYCVYTGTTSQRAKAIRINREYPSLDTLLAILRDKFKSDLSLGFIEEDGSYSEVLSDEDLLAIIKKAPENAESIALHCWTQAPQFAMELAYGHDYSSRAATPSNKSVGGRSVASATSAKSGVSFASTTKTGNKSRPTSALSNRSAASSTGRKSKPPQQTKKAKKSHAPSSAGGSTLDVSGQAYTEDQLRELFEELDVDCSGYLDIEEMRKLFLERYDPMGVDNAEQQFESFLQKCGCFDDGMVTFDEFAIVMLKLAQW